MCAYVLIFGLVIGQALCNAPAPGVGEALASLAHGVR